MRPEPPDAGSTPADTVSEKYLRLAPLLAFIERNLHRPIRATELAQRMHVSRFHFLHLFKDATGETMGQYCTRLRMERAKAMLESGSRGLEQIAMKIGLPSSKALSYHFKKRFRVPPSRFHRFSACLGENAEVL
jgi:AraC-like DNA-binding protein